MAAYDRSDVGDARRGPISVVGAGAVAREVVAVQLARGEPVEDLVVEPGMRVADVAGLPVLDDPAAMRRPDRAYLIAIGDGRTRRRIAIGMAGLPFGCAIHPAAVIGPRVTIREGAMILGSMSATVDVEIGSHALINPGCTLAHDVRLGPYVTLGPSVTLAGGVSVQEGAFVGAGAIVLPGLTVGAWATVGAGTVVLADVPPDATVVGVPARLLPGGRPR